VRSHARSKEVRPALYYLSIFKPIEIGEVRLDLVTICHFADKAAAAGQAISLGQYLVYRMYAFLYLAHLTIEVVEPGWPDGGRRSRSP
jgi:hypothetical protein